MKLEFVDLNLAVQGRSTDAQQLRCTAHVALRRLERTGQQPLLFRLQGENIVFGQTFALLGRRLVPYSLVDRSSRWVKSPGSRSPPG